MLQTTFCFLVVLLSAVYGQQQRQVLYSRLVDEVTDYSLSVLYGAEEHFSHCAELCFEDNYCMEFLYSETSRQCIGLHYVKKRNYSYENVVPLSTRMLHFKRVFVCGICFDDKGFPILEFNWIEHSGHFYYYGGKDKKLTWPKAKLECKKMGAHLVKIESKEESDWLASEFIMRDDCSPHMYETCTAWTGGHDRSTEGHYMWVHSNTSLEFTNWSPSETSFGNWSDCIDILRNGKWNDRHCWFLNSFICERNSVQI